MSNAERRFGSAIVAVLLVACVAASRGQNRDGMGQINDAVEVAKHICVRAGGPGPDGSSWDTALPDIQLALNQVGKSGGTCEIWVAKGVYRPSKMDDLKDERSATFQLITGALLYGGFNGDETNRLHRDWRYNVTTLSGDIGKPGDDSDNSYHVVKGFDGTRIDGFTICGGRAMAPPCGWPRGGGMLNSTGSPAIVNCTFVDNWASYGGGGMYNERAGPRVQNCRFIRNRAYCRSDHHWIVEAEGGAIFNEYAGPTVIGCVFLENTAGPGEPEAGFYGGAILNRNSSLTITACVFERNWAASCGGGICNRVTKGSPNYRLEIEDCLLLGNSAGMIGGAMHNEPLFAVRTNKCLFIANVPAAN